MDKLLRYVMPVVGFVLIVVGIGAYLYLTSMHDSSKELAQVLKDESYLKEKQQNYADCYYSTKSNSDFSIPKVTNKFYNEGASKDKLVELEAKYLGKYSEMCKPVIADYENRYKSYKDNQLILAKSRQTELQKLMKSEPVIDKQPSDIVSFYEMYEPKSLQYPTYDKGKLIFSAEEYSNFLNENL